TTEPGRIGVLGSHLPEVVEVMRYSQDAIDGAVAGDLAHAEASRRIFERLGACDFLPPYMGFGDPDQHVPATFTLLAGARHVNWYRRNASARWRENCVFPLTTYARHALGFVLDTAGDSIRQSFSGTRDVFFASNKDWQYLPAALSAHGRKWAPIPEFVDVEVKSAETIDVS
ncbi:MAG: tetracycline 7-halogenase / O2-dependent halogenase, partial [Micromonosporaceae bacterium]|nr:tetracycline 7-halogenase / O2-dependent halogenase [Micromonosporaceae bacterium]